MKTCSDCKVAKTLSHFGKDKNKKDGLKYLCKFCHNKRNRKLRGANPEKHRSANLAYARSPEGKARQRMNSLRRKFWPHKTNEEAANEYEALLLKQGHKCGLCDKPKTLFKVALAVDHCHATKVVRGLLCNKCNRFEVGRHTVESARQLYLYLLKHNSK